MDQLHPAGRAYRPVRPSALAVFHEICALVARPRADAGAASPSGPPGAGHTVLAIPPLLTDDRETGMLRAALARAGHAAFGWDLGLDLGPTPGLMDGAEGRLLTLYAEHGPVSLIGLSMGGLFCRWLATAIRTACDWS